MTAKIMETMKKLSSSDKLLHDLRTLIPEARQDVARNVNSALLYWKVGERIRKDVLGGKRAGYGEEILSTMSKELTAESEDGHSGPNLFKMVRFAEILPKESIVSTLSRQLEKKQPSLPGGQNQVGIGEGKLPGKNQRGRPAWPKNQRRKP